MRCSRQARAYRCIDGRNAAPRTGFGGRMGFPIPDRVGSGRIGFARAGERVARGAQSYSENWYLKHKKKEDRTEVLSPVLLVYSRY